MSNVAIRLLINRLNNDLFNSLFWTNCRLKQDWRPKDILRVWQTEQSKQYLKQIFALNTKILIICVLMSSNDLFKYFGDYSTISIQNYLKFIKAKLGPHQSLSHDQAITILIYGLDVFGNLWSDLPLFCVIAVIAVIINELDLLNLISSEEGLIEEENVGQVASYQYFHTSIFQAFLLEFITFDKAVGIGEVFLQFGLPVVLFQRLRGCIIHWLPLHVL